MKRLVFPVVLAKDQCEALSEGDIDVSSSFIFENYMYIFIRHNIKRNLRIEKAIADAPLQNNATVSFEYFTNDQRKW